MDTIIANELSKMNIKYDNISEIRTKDGISVYQDF